MYFPRRISLPALIASLGLVLLASFSSGGGTLPGAGPAVAAPVSQTASTTPEAALQQLFTATRVQVDWFTPELLQQLPAAQIDSLLATVKSNLGTFRMVSAVPGGYLAGFDNGALPVRVSLDSRGRISALLLGQPKFADPALARSKAVSDLQALPGHVSLLVLQDGQDQVSVHPEDRLAVSSAVQLAVLAGLRQQVSQAQRAWTDVVALRPEWKTLPAGALQDWPDGAALTLDTLSTMMMSLGDNTATDAIMALVGRDGIEQMAAGNRPVPTPRQLFVLKDPKNQDLLDRWRTGDETARLSVLQAADQKPNPAPDLFANGPLAMDVEYFFSTRVLCGLMKQVADLPLMSINAGLADRGSWSRAAFKGGSEPGIINATHWLVDKDGRTYCVAASWNNDSPLDESQFLGPLRQLISSLAPQS